MKTLYELCKPRESVFDPTKREDVLDLSNLIENSIDPEEFFEENYLTDGMKVLLDNAFRRFDGRGDSGLIKLTQNMGGGKTHNMIALGLLARYPEYRLKVLGDNHGFENVGKIKVVAFSGRETHYPYGIWGSIAEQLGKKDLFSSFYSPLSAPGQSAWQNLLQEEPTLILLDELPFYLENAKSKEIGNSDLSIVTTTALANLFVAIDKKQLSKVCLVISDLRATYESGSELLQSSFKELENETNRYALDIEPVGSTSDEVYHILRKRLFKELPSGDEIKPIAQEYKKLVKEAQQMDLTTIDPDNIYVGIMDSYPFHPSIRDLYARFKENQGFQQTRGLIRLMRVMVSQLYKENGKKASKKYIINAYELDLNEKNMLSSISQIKPSLTNAIAHDIASEGQAIAESIDKIKNSVVVQDISKLFLVASLANVPNAILGLSLQEATGYLCEPGRDSREIRTGFDDFSARAWYLHSDRDDNFFFQDTKNLIAQLNTLIGSYDNESAKKELRYFLKDKFIPSMKDCYQDVIIFPAIDEIRLSPEKVLLVLTEPYIQGGLNPKLQNFYNDTPYKNRVMFLTGQRNTMDNLLRSAKEYKAIQKILQEMRDEKITEKDTQFELAVNKLDKLRLNLLQAARETFMTIYYPSKKGLLTADFLMEFKNNNYNGEEQIRMVLKDKQKFEEQPSGDTFRKKVEAKLFTVKEMQWSHIKDRSATDPSWLWYIPNALDHLRDEMIKKELWRNAGNYVDKGPFPKECTEIQIQQIKRDPDTGEVLLKINPKHGDKVFYEIDSPATPSSLLVEDINDFRTDEMIISFLAVDSTGEHPTGNPREWRNEVTLKHRIYDEGNDKKVELKAAPSSAKIKYTTDGSNPKENGGIYDESFTVPESSRIVLAIAEKKGLYSENREIKIDRNKNEDLIINKDEPLVYSKRSSTTATKESYEAIELLKKFNITLSDLTIDLIKEGKEEEWIQLTFSETLKINPETIEKQIEEYRETYFKDASVTVKLEWSQMHFGSGQDFFDWIAAKKLTLNSFKSQEIIQ